MSGVRKELNRYLNAREALEAALTEYAFALAERHKGRALDDADAIGDLASELLTFSDLKSDFRRTYWGNREWNLPLTKETGT